MIIEKRIGEKEKYIFEKGKQSFLMIFTETNKIQTWIQILDEQELNDSHSTLSEFDYPSEIRVVLGDANNEMVMLLARQLWFQLGKPKGIGWIGIGLLDPAQLTIQSMKEKLSVIIP